MKVCWRLIDFPYLGVECCKRHKKADSFLNFPPKNQEVHKVGGVEKGSDNKSQAIFFFALYQRFSAARLARAQLHRECVSKTPGHKNCSFFFLLSPPTTSLLAKERPTSVAGPE